MAKYLRAVPQRKGMIKKSELSVDLSVGDKVIVKYRDKGRHSKKICEGKVILNDDKHPYFQIHNGITRKSFLKVDVLIKHISVSKIS